MGRRTKRRWLSARKPRLSHNADVLPEKMKRKQTSTSLNVFVILMVIGIIGGLVDGIAYQVHVYRQGVGLFSVVPFAVWTAYLKTFPGNVLTCLWLVPWVLGFLFFCIPRGNGN